MKGHNHDGVNHHAHMIADFRRRFWVCLALTIPILILSPFIQQLLGFDSSIRFLGDELILFGLSTIVFFYGGYPFVKGFLVDIKTRRPGMMTLITVAIATAYFYSSVVTFGLKGQVFFWELATLIDVMLLGHWLEMRSVAGASKALEKLARLMPSVAHKILPDGSISDVSLDMLKIKDKVIVKPGEKIPADGKILEGDTSVNEAMLTGESKPVYKIVGHQVIGGSVNGEGSITVEVDKTGADSFLSQVIELVKQAQKSKSRTQDLANTAALWLTIIALSGGALTFVVWLLLFDASVAFSLERSVTVMVITCPHALGLAIPLVTAVSTAISANNGLLIRNRISFEQARDIKAVIFDKTGTLTKGEFGVTDVVLFDNKIGKEELIRLAASVESRSEHPIAKSIVSSADQTYPAKEFKAIVGKGAQAKINNMDIKVVSPGYLHENKITYKDEEVSTLSDEGKTVVFVVIGNEAKGAIALADIVRKESREAVKKLKEMGIKCMMLTGDNKKVAAWVAKDLGLDEYFAEVLPQEKAAIVKEVQEKENIVAMTGDGVNDAPALAQANVGIAIGAGTDVAIEAADVVLVKNNPLDVVKVIDLSRVTFRKMVQNLIWATGYNIVAIPLAAGVLYSINILLSPALGAAAMSLSTIIVVINAQLLNKWKVESY